MESKLQRQEPKKARTDKPDLTGIPAQMKTDFERRSGLSFDDVRVHYNSDKPAQMQALAYTQGTQVYVGPGQERHLPHELGHVIQQKTGKVRPTRYIGRMPVNDQPQLEREADRMPIQRKPSPAADGVVQFALTPPFNGNPALFGSVHKDNADGGQTKLGSIYFRGGRIRLIHDLGAEISERSEAIRYLIHANKPEDISNAAKEIERLHRQMGRKWAASVIISKLDSSKVRAEVLPDDKKDVQSFKPDSTFPESQIFEVFFDNGEYAGRHISRGGFGNLPDTITKPAEETERNLEVLSYVVKTLQDVANLSAGIFSHCITGQEMAGQLQKFPLIDYLTNSIRHSWKTLTEPERAQKDIRGYFQNMVNTLNPEGFKVITDNALKKAKEYSTDKREKRFGGYISNVLLKNSGILEALNLPVDKDD